MKTPIFAMIFVGLLASLDCGKSQAPPPPPPPTGPPPLEASFPFGKLGSGKLVFNRLGPPANNYSSVYVVDISAVRSWAISIGDATAPMVSPDGSKIALSKFANDTSLFDIHVMNIDGSNIKNISSLPGQDRQPTWTPDSQQVLFYTDLTPQVLYSQSAIPTSTSLQTIRTFNDGTISSPFSVSENLQLAFVFAPWQPLPNIYLMNIDGTSLMPISSMTQAPAGYEIYSPCWSPDASKIAYMLVPVDWASNPLQIFVVGADGNNMQSIASFMMNPPAAEWASYNWDNKFSICWSPDGSKLLFNKCDGDYCYHLYVMNADGTDISQVTFADSVTDRSVSWSK